MLEQTRQKYIKGVSPLTKGPKEDPPPKPALLNITINLPDLFLECIQELIVQERVPSRSEAIRNALREFLSKEIAFINDLKKMGSKES